MITIPFYICGICGEICYDTPYLTGQQTIDLAWIHKFSFCCACAIQRRLGQRKPLPPE